MHEPGLISVLYVDDEPQLSEIAQAYLEREHGFAVKKSSSGPDALDALKNDSYDVIVSDYQMPGMDGIAFLKHAKADCPDVPFILFTGKGREEVVIEAINNAAASYIQKGGDPAAQFAELAHKIREAVGRSRVEEVLRKNYETLRLHQEAIREREEYYRAVFENTGTAMIVIDENTTISLANAQSERLSVYSRTEIEGKKRWTEFVPREELDRMLGCHRLRREDSGKAPRNYEFHMLTRSVELRTIDLTIDLIPGTKKSVASLIDVTDRARTEEALRQSKTLHRTIFEMSPDAIVLADASGILRYVSPAAVRLFGLDSEKDALGAPLFHWVPPKMRSETTARVLRFIGSALPPSISSPYILQKKDGTRFFAETSSAVLTGPDGKPSGMISILRDVTERIATDKALRRASAKLNPLSSVTRHDILNKLTVLLGYLELARQARDPEAVTDFLSKVDGIAGILEEQIQFTKDYQDLGINNPHWQGVSTLVTKALDKLDLGQVRVTDPCSTLEIFADPLLEKVVYNLLENALRHGGDVRMIRIRYETVGNEPVWIFEDDVTGVVASDKEKIFNKGFGKNTGLGLFLAREILAITGMDIMETGFPKSGARFEIRVPAGNFRFSSRTMPKVS